MARKGQKFKTFEEELIYKIVQEKILGKCYSELARKYNVAPGSIMTWVKRFKDKGYVNRDKKGKGKDIKNMTIEELRMEVDILKKFQAFLKQQHVKR